LFYRERQIKHLMEEIDKKIYIFTLIADLKECLIRNNKRENPLEKKAIIDVYNLVSKIDIGIKIQTKEKTIEEIVKEINSKISLDWMR